MTAIYAVFEITEDQLYCLMPVLRKDENVHFFETCEVC